MKLRGSFFLPALVGFTLTGTLLAQAPPNRLCRQWDDAYLSAFQTGLVIAVVVGFIAYWVLGVLARRLWLLTSLTARLFLATIAGGVFIALLWVVIPANLYLGGWHVAAVDPAYRECFGRDFGATGLFGGTFGAGVAALGQGPALLTLCFVAALVGSALAWAVGLIITRLKFPVRRAVN